MNARAQPLFVLPVVLAVFLSALHDARGDDPGIEQLLARVPDGGGWNDLPVELQNALEKRANDLLAQDHQNWGLSGLEQKHELLVSAPTAAMTENIDRVLSITYASELPGGFRMLRDVQDATLKSLLIKIYLAITADRGFMLSNHPEFKGWDGLPVREVPLLDHAYTKAMATWLQETETGLRGIPDDRLSLAERAIRAKSYFTTRAGKHFDAPALGINGSIGYSSLYSLPTDQRPFVSDAAMLDAYNASMFTQFREVNMGTLDGFMYDYDSEYNMEWLASQKMPDALAKEVMKLGKLYLTRVQNLPDTSKRCTIFSATERDANWDAFTAGQISNADQTETMESYARLFATSADRRLVQMRELGRLTLERLFPDGSPELSVEQRLRVSERLQTETRPAKMLDTLLSALDEISGSPAASAKVKDTMAKQPTVGGGYAPGEPVRESDKKQIMEMWNKIRAFVSREYSGYRVDIASLIPAEPIIVTTGQNQFTVGGQVNLSLGKVWNLASFSSTLMHEVKHAIDQNSHAAVEGAAWEGAATSIERLVWPTFIEEAMASQADLLPVARLQTEIDNVRFTATTDATLKIYMRETCDDGEPDTIEYAEGIVRSYGYEDAAFLRFRSQRAHRSTQYFAYDYGLAIYSDLLSYLQQKIGNSPRVDAYLLQACNMPNPKKDQATAEDLQTCIRDRKP